ncbi:CatB-related O-acetyltransferase [Bacillus subtilis]|uniref:CatB-related O-acetyltransferase n=1 Tax=Pseudochrobactrum asaccharolyticum TaxID=354351 RepID=UPI001F30C539|nr:CatB-related O-acetyltransferase [Pseudochrobactrum asaccharolyticum]MCF7645784.1 CatB-related O-acetyltransferase [Pseudochrobactrum asaccharolyticum]MCF7671151.1 CatB-related O-acetyltransferase [Bacillus subtilis]
MSGRQDTVKHWSKVEMLADTVKNPNIHIRGKNSYYSDAWSGSFEESVVRYHYGDEYSLSHWEPLWEIDQLYIGDYVCIGAEAVILMGGNHTHRTDWFSLYPFLEVIQEAYVAKGDTVIEDGAWVGMRAMIMPGVTIGEGAIVASGALVTKSVAPYTIVAGNPASPIKQRFPEATTEQLLALKIYQWDKVKFDALRTYICSDNIDLLVDAAKRYDDTHS